MQTEIASKSGVMVSAPTKNRSTKDKKMAKPAEKPAAVGPKKLTLSAPPALPEEGGELTAEAAIAALPPVVKWVSKTVALLDEAKASELKAQDFDALVGMKTELDRVMKGFNALTKGFGGLQSELEKQALKINKAIAQQLGLSTDSAPGAVAGSSSSTRGKRLRKKAKESLVHATLGVLDSDEEYIDDGVGKEKIVAGMMKTKEVGALEMDQEKVAGSLSSVVFPYLKQHGFATMEGKLGKAKYKITQKGRNAWGSREYPDMMGDD